VEVSADGKHAYVSCQSGGQVAEIDLVNWRTSKGISTGNEPDGLAWTAAK
jgi:hypothetical protein